MGAAPIRTRRPFALRAFDLAGQFRAQGFGIVAQPLRLITEILQELDSRAVGFVHEAILPRMEHGVP